MPKAPAFQFYVKQWLGDDKVMLMDWAARGMHMHLICIAWQQDPVGTLPNDDEMLRAWCGHPADWDRLKPQILRAWTLENGRWVQKGLLESHQRQEAFSKSRSNAAKARWSSKKAPATPETPPELGDAYAMHTPCESHVDVVEDVEEVKDKEVVEVVASQEQQAVAQQKVTEMRRPAASETVVMQGSMAANGGPVPYSVPARFPALSALPPADFTDAARDRWVDAMWKRHPKKRDMLDAHAALEWVYDQGPEEQTKFERHHEVMCKSLDWTKQCAKYCPKMSDYIRNTQYDEALPEPEPAKTVAEETTPYPEFPEL